MKIKKRGIGQHVARGILFASAIGIVSGILSCSPDSGLSIEDAVTVIILITIGAVILI